MTIINQINEETRDIIKQCLKATVEGPFFPDWEFQTLMGVERKIVKFVYEAWPNQTVGDEDFKYAVINSLNNLLGYPHGEEKVWKEYISVEPEKVRLILNELIALGF